MSAGQSGRAFVHRTTPRAVLGGSALSLLFLLSLAWSIGQPPATAFASGVPYCGKLAEEQAPTRPAIHLDRSEGPIGTNLTVTAANWRPGAHVTLDVDGREPKTGHLYILMPAVAQGVVASDGTLTLTPLTAPSFLCVDLSTNPNTEYLLGAPGTIAYFVVDANDGEVSAPLTFSYLAAPTISLSGGAQEVTVGSSLVVTGSGWEPQEAMAITLTSTGISSQRDSTGEPVRTTADGQGAFRVLYPIAATWPWYTNSRVLVQGSGPRFGTLQVSAPVLLLPAVQPTLQIDRTLVTPGMTITVSGEHWYPGDSYTLTYCDALLQGSGWVEGPNCGKAVNPLLGTVTVDANGRMHQQFRIPDDQPPGAIMVRIPALTNWIHVPPIALHVVDHLPTWDDAHPRAAAVRNLLLGSLPVTVPAALLLGALAIVGLRLQRKRQSRV